MQCRTNCALKIPATRAGCASNAAWYPASRISADETPASSGRSGENPTATAYSPISQVRMTVANAVLRSTSSASDTCLIGNGVNSRNPTKPGTMSGDELAARERRGDQGQGSPARTTLPLARGVPCQTVARCSRPVRCLGWASPSRTGSCSSASSAPRRRGRSSQLPSARPPASRPSCDPECRSVWRWRSFACSMHTSGLARLLEPAFGSIAGELPRYARAAAFPARLRLREGARGFAPLSDGGAAPSGTTPCCARVARR